jgi:hypothetical protein
VELNEHPGADAAPPALRIGPSLIPHTAVDWKAPGLPAFAIDNSQDPSKFGSIACGKRLSLELSSVAAPAALEVSSIFVRLLGAGNIGRSDFGYLRPVLCRPFSRGGALHQHGRLDRVAFGLSEAASAI